MAEEDRSTLGQRGLEPRYEVIKLHDPEGKHEGCRYFVLDPKHDKVARAALSSYATRTRLEGNEQLYMDLMDWLQEIEDNELRATLERQLETLKDRPVVFSEEESYGSDSDAS